MKRYAVMALLFAWRKRQPSATHNVPALLHRFGVRFAGHEKFAMRSFVCVDRRFVVTCPHRPVRWSHAYSHYRNRNIRPLGHYHYVVVSFSGFPPQARLAFFRFSARKKTLPLSSGSPRRKERLFFFRPSGSSEASIKYLWGQPSQIQGYIRKYL
jgi:hypothetical protein